MAKIIELSSFEDDRGCLTVIENVFPFDIKRIFYIYDVDNSVRGGHRHHQTWQAAICLNGACKVTNNDGRKKEVFELTRPNQCLILGPQDWHEMHDFSKDAIFLVVASHKFDPKDYIYDNYKD
jgi:dTDP-4-dehydrorhamnose 3,5-epimerase-like enzyme